MLPPGLKDIDVLGQGDELSIFLLLLLNGALQVGVTQGKFLPTGKLADLNTMQESLEVQVKDTLSPVLGQVVKLVPV